jgi:hypothetical protein
MVRKSKSLRSLLRRRLLKSTKNRLIRPSLAPFGKCSGPKCQLLSINGSERNWQPPIGALVRNRIISH